MRFICLGYYDEKAWEAMTERERHAFVDECFEYDDVLRKNEQFIGGEALESGRNAVTVRLSSGKVTVTDGPYANTKEELGGILVVEAPDLDHAVQIVSKHPGLKGGPFEVRPGADLSAMAADSARRRAAEGKAVPGAGLQAGRQTGTRIRRITPFLWFDGRAEEAATRYVSIFPNSRIINVTRYSEEAAAASGRPAGTVMTVVFELEGHEFIALNGGPEFTFSPAISFVVNCGNQDEVDALWEKLSEGGATDRCGWLKDRYGVSWQIVPTVLGEMLQDPDPEKSRRVVAAIMQMDKLDIETLQRAYARQEPGAGGPSAKSA